MCGIVGVHDTKKHIDHRILDEMTDIISHRGPDGRGTFIDKSVGFGHRRLSIIDLSRAGDQPMKSDDNKYTITYNGEIYNYLNIRCELESKGHIFKSNTDTEVILKSYIEWGFDCLNKFNGMFAFGIWDNLKKQIFIARDRYGIKPIYYYWNEDLFIFSSEIKSILLYPSIKVDVSFSALNQYFTFQNIFTDETLFKNIKLLPAGNYANLSLVRNKLDQKKYWDFHFEEDSNIKSENECIEELTYLLRRSVQRQL